MSILTLPHAAPRVLLFDWHGTLVDTHDAAYCAIDDVLPRLAELGLMDRVTNVDQCKTLEDARLVKYVLDHRRLHPKVKAERKVSRTDVFEMLFGPDEDAKRIAHEEFHETYRNHDGHVTLLETGFASVLAQLQSLGLILGVLTNRDREFLEQEIRAVGEHGWSHFFTTVVCGDDVARRKPAPDSILKALDNVGFIPGPNTWYVGDSAADAVAAKSAGVDQHLLQRRGLEPGLARQDLSWNGSAPPPTGCCSQQQRRAFRIGRTLPSPLRRATRRHNRTGRSSRAGR